jgi:hypothetical protein
VAEASDPPDQIREHAVQLEIQGNETHGYNLVMSPEGLFTADSSYESLNDAIEGAAEIFGVERSAWQGDES